MAAWVPKRDVQTRLWIGRALKAVCLSGLVLTGCSESGPKIYEAGGRVEFADGKPLPGGTVEFRSLDQKPVLSARGLIGPDGTFRLGTRTQSDGAVEGRHSVMVMPALPELDRDEIRGPLPQPIDEKFQQFGTSGLEFTVTSDESQNEFVIKVHPPAK